MSTSMTHEYKILCDQKITKKNAKKCSFPQQIQKSLRWETETRPVESLPIKFNMNLGCRFYLQYIWARVSHTQYVTSVGLCCCTSVHIMCIRILQFICLNGQHPYNNIQRVLAVGFHTHTAEQRLCRTRRQQHARR